MIAALNFLFLYDVDSFSGFKLTCPLGKKLNISLKSEQFGGRKDKVCIVGKRAVFATPGCRVASLRALAWSGGLPDLFDTTSRVVVHNHHIPEGSALSRARIIEHNKLACLIPRQFSYQQINAFPVFKTLHTIK